jgi:predicted nucleotidyltransferase
MLSIAARYGVKNIRVFGSVARGDASINSDIDLLIEMEKGRSLLALAEFTGEAEISLEEKLMWLQKHRFIG